MTFGEALEHLKNGEKIKRKDWKKYWRYMEVESLELYGGFSVIVSASEDDSFPEYAPVTTRQDDIMAEDWEVVE